MKDQKAIQDMEIKEAIDLIKVERHKRMLRDFQAGFQEGDSFLVTSHDDYFEIIVSHPSVDNLTGGAEQYFLDKNTGKSKMGWHEHPGEIPMPENQSENI